MIENFYEYQCRQNILYTEAFLSGTFLIQKFGIESILEAIKIGVEKGEKKGCARVKFIVDISHQEPESQAKVLDLAIEGYRNNIIIGLGLGGIENNYPPDLFAYTYKKAKKAGLRLVAHAGETAGAESIWGAIKYLNAEQIGHGIRCLEDNKLIRLLKETKLPIEVSPTSNYRLSIVQENQKHPIRKMVDEGLFCTINSDDPAMFSTNLSNEYDLLFWMIPKKLSYLLQYYINKVRC